MAKKKSNGGGGGGGAGGDQKNNENNNDGDKNIVLKLHLHCEGCTTRIRKSIIGFPGVVTVNFEGDDKAKIMTHGNIDIAKLRDRVEKKTGKKVEIISPQPKKDQEKNNNKAKNDKSKEPPVTTVVLKVSWHCYGCGERIHKTISSFKGVYDLSIDKEEDTVKVTGKMDPKKLVEELREKLKRPVDIIPEKEKEKEKEKKDGSGGGNKGGGDKGGGGGGGGDKGCCCRIDHCHVAVGHGHWDGYTGQVVVDPFYYQAPQIFSDENANGCSIM